MIEHTKEQIEQVREYFQREAYPLIKENIAGRSLEYFLVPQVLNQDLPKFIYRSTNSSLEEYVLGISEDVPESLQPYFALAEYIEFKEKNLKTINRVMDTEKEILTIIPKELRKEYIENKLKLFQRELYLDTVNPEVYQLEEEGRREFSKAVNFLERELSQYKVE